MGSQWSVVLIITHVAQQLNVEIADVEELLINLILEGKVDGRIDQVGMRLELDRTYVSPLRYLAYTDIDNSQDLERKRYAALNSWEEALDSLHAAVVAKMAGRSAPEPFSTGPERLSEFRDIVFS